MPEPVVPWRRIRDRYEGGGLVLGNGASIAFDARFGYASLFATAREQNRLDRAADVFQRFGTEDFERVLRLLWTAQGVSEALGVAGAHDFQTRYEQVRTALIQTVRAIHPTYRDVEARLPRAAAFLRDFRTVASLSYDVLVYWALLLGNQENRAHTFKDAFLDGTFADDWRRLRNPQRPGHAVTLVCYPHGHLALVREWGRGNVRKLAAEGALLLDTIEAEWQIRRATPLFVSEGEAQQKRDAIASSPYLSVVERELLPDLPKHEDGRTRTLVTLGWAFGEQDEHLLASLARTRVQRLAVSMDPQQNPDQLETQQTRIRGLVRQHRLLPNHQAIEWFSYRSRGCWLVP